MLRRTAKPDTCPLISDLEPLWRDGAHRGGMIALVPSAADAARLALPGGEPADELHVTLCYFGNASAMAFDERAAVVDEGAGCDGEASKGKEKSGNDTAAGEDRGDGSPNESAEQPQAKGGKGEGSGPPQPGDGLGKYFEQHPDEYQAYKESRLARVKQIVVDEKRSTDRLNSASPPDPAEEVGWSDDRMKEHERILNAVHTDEASSVPNEREAVILGGLPGAGKTTALNNYADTVGIDSSRFASVNPDDFKEVLVGHGMVPKYEGVAPMEAAWAMHEESSYLSKQYFDRLAKEGKNIALDVTMGGLGSFRGDKGYLAKLKAAGYKIKMVYVDTRPETSLKRANARHRNGIDKPYGGRMVPDTEILHATSKRGFNSKNRDNFEDIKGEGDEWYTFDNDGDSPKLVDSWDGRHAGTRVYRSVEELLQEVA